MAAACTARGDQAAHQRASMGRSEPTSSRMTKAGRPESSDALPTGLPVGVSVAERISSLMDSQGSLLGNGAGDVGHGSGNLSPSKLQTTSSNPGLTGKTHLPPPTARTGQMPDRYPNAGMLPAKSDRPDQKYGYRIHDIWGHSNDCSQNSTRRPVATSRVRSMEGSDSMVRFRGRRPAGSGVESGS